MGQFLPRPGDKFRHFKDGLYQVLTTAEHSESGEKMIVYQALYGDFKVYVRPYNMFISRVDHQKYPQVKQEFRFTYVEDPATEAQPEQPAAAAEASRHYSWEHEAETTRQPMKELKPRKEEPQVSQEELKAADEMLEDMMLEDMKAQAEKAVIGLIDFLDADTYAKKLQILNDMKNRLNDDILQAMADSLEIVLNAEDLEEKYQELRHCIRTFEKYEKTR